MFTGIIETIGKLQAREIRADGQRLTIEHPGFDDQALHLGESISVAGVCLTVAGQGPGRFTTDVSDETLRCSTLGALNTGARVNLERALKLGERLGGHWVAGHVDGVGEVAGLEDRGENRGVRVAMVPKLAQYIAVKGSITVDGVSLTVNAANHAGFEVNLVPHTLAVTTLTDLRPGSRVNLEVDLVARYLSRLLEQTYGQN